MIELSELIRQLRTELSKAVEQAPDTGLRFELGPVEVEVSVAVDKRAGAGGKVRFWVVELGSDAGVSENSVQRVKVTLKPRTSGGETPYVSGKSEPGEL